MPSSEAEVSHEARGFRGWNNHAVGDVVRPSGVVTFLFTDIEGSTRLWEQNPEAMSDSLALHDEILLGAIKSYGGYVFSTGGDGFAAAFASAAAGLAAAIDAQTALGSEEWGESPIRVRMGLHLGEAEERDGDYFGPVLNRAARIMAAGNGGQILTTETFAQLVGSEGLSDLGEHRLRDLSGPQRLFQVGDVEFPQLRTIDAYASNLPHNLSSFIGRDAQVAKVAEDLLHRDLVTLTGAGGVGKTRLAVQACAEALPKFPAGAWFVDLAAVRDPEQVAGAVATVLGVKERAGEPLAVTLRDSLRDRKAVLLLDNAEHVVDALAELLQEMRSRDIAASFLVTSREPLGVDGEQVRRVASLDSDEGTQLFMERASSVRAEIEWAGYRSTVVEICERLDGIPLAIELAAARSRSMLPSDILRRLDERFRLLSGGNRTARERHQTLLAAVEWSYDLLDEEERTFFDRLAVFRGGFSLEAAEAVCSGDTVDELDVVDLLDRLVDKSMVIALEQRDRSRYRMMETLRQFGESRLVASARADEFRDRHVDYFRDFAGEWAPVIRSPRQIEAVAEVAAETGNLEAALDWLIASDQVAEFRRLCTLLHGYWTATARPEGSHWYGVLLENLDGLDPSERAEALAQASYLVTNSGEYGRGRLMAEQAIEAADQAGCHRSGYAYFALAMEAGADGDNPGALRYGVLATEAARAEGNELLETFSQGMAMGAQLDMQHPDAAAALAEAVAAAEALQVPTLVASVRMSQGRQFSLAGDHESAEAFFAEAIETGRATVPHAVVVSHLYRSEGRLRRSDPDVLEGLDEALNVFADTPVQPEVIAEIWAIIATVWLRQGRVTDAAILASASGALLTSIGVRGRAANAYVRQELGDDLAAGMSAEELDAHIEAAQDMTADDVHRFIMERLEPSPPRSEDPGSGHEPRQV